MNTLAAEYQQNLRNTLEEMNRLYGESQAEMAYWRCRFLAMIDSESNFKNLNKREDQ